MNDFDTQDLSNETEVQIEVIEDTTVDSNDIAEMNADIYTCCCMLL